MIFDWQTAERLQCVREDKEELLQLVDVLVKASERARREGLLALEDGIEEFEHPIVRLGLQLVVDGTDPEIIESLLTAKMLSENKRGKEFLAQMLIYTAVLSIQSGDNPRILMEKCMAYFGEDADELQERRASTVVNDGESRKIKDYLATDGNEGEFFDTMRVLLSFDDRAVQKVLREIDLSQLTKILCGADSDVRKKVVKNMSRRAAVLLVEGDAGPAPTADSVRVGIDGLMQIVEKLGAAGEIIIPD